MTRPSSSPEASNYLLFSDVHLGADLVQHTRPWTAARLQEAHRIDHELGSMLDYYREHSDPVRPWRLVIAGDFIDLVGMSISAEEGATLTEDERVHGLGSSELHAAVKMKAVAVRHDLLFRKLARFVSAGHSLVFVRGNHDVEFYWDAAQRAFLDALLERSDCDRSDADACRAFEERIEFRHWFYYVQGLLYVEHGHQFDATCAYQHVLAPRSPRDPRRISYSCSDILLRYVVRPTRELSPEGHDNTSLFDYLRLAFSLGIHGCARLGMRFFGAVGRMVSSWREHVSEAAAHVRAEHEQRLQQIAAMFRVSSERLRAMTQLWATPVTAKLTTIFRTVFLDGLAALFCSGASIALLALAGIIPWSWLPGLLAVVLVGLYAYVKSSRVLEPHAALRRAASKLAELMPARYVVMGHTHRPTMEKLTPESTYVNLGNWTDDLLNDRARSAPCTHLVIRQLDSGRSAAVLYRWESAGPRALHSAEPTEPSAASVAPEPAAVRPVVNVTSISPPTAS